MFVTLGAVARPEDQPSYAIEGYAYGLSKRSFEASGGKVIDEIPMGGPAQVPDFTPFFQRAKDKKPDVFFVFVPAGDHAPPRTDRLAPPARPVAARCSPP